MSRRTVFCFTWNNPPENAISFLKHLIDDAICIWCVVGEEVGESGTPHLQGTLCTAGQNVKIGRSENVGIRKLFKPINAASSIHWERCQNVEKSIEYCKKDGKFQEFGNVQIIKSGTRTDLDDACEELLEHRDLSRFKKEHPSLFVRYSKGFSSLLEYPERDSEKPPIVYWIYGPTGVGKTRMVFEREKEDLWFSGESLQWFDGYIGQKSVIIDDFRGSFCKFHTLLRYLDRYPIKVAVKGAFVNWAPEKIYITSCVHPRSAYNLLDEKIDQLIRRITHIIHVPFRTENDVLTNL